ncbi:alpha/beta hydrolase [Oscillatoriales cyanobacterium LEGE 11467]|uniref:Alpha/beta hydrolase n=1 Tax=Zarconia navalis LEGE 11467 TaxID=1828826 RepID=A0A928VWE9_9CYAN|nr:alpha/beta hydrolase [Zarconia navalis]MBE9041487.1 alpha/beta hydrolase [Zarconia navalis LEGE 11467]
MSTTNNKLHFLNPQSSSPACEASPSSLGAAEPKENRPLFVFLPGMDGTGKLLHLQTPGLRTTFDMRCLSLPNRDDRTGWDDLAYQTIDLIHRELKDRSNRSVYLCGESFGGCLALQVIVRAPELFDGLILVNPASSFRKRAWMAWGIPLIRSLVEPIYQLSTFGLLPFLIALDRVSKRDRQQLVTAMQSVSSATASWRLSLLRDFDILPVQLHQFKKPALLLASQGDRLLPSVEEAENLARFFPNPKTIVLPDSGHVCLLESEFNLYQVLQETQFLPEFANC